VKRVASRSGACCSRINIASTIVICVHTIKAFAVSAAQGISLVETVAGCIVTIVVESDKLLGIRTLGGRAPSGFSTAVSFDAITGANIFCPIINPLNSSPFVLPLPVVNADGVESHTAEDVVITFVADPGDAAWKTLVQGWLLNELKCTGVGDRPLRLGERRCG